MNNFEILTSQGACAEVDTNLMYPDENDLAGIAIAKSICSGCVVVDMCREYSLKRDESGIWAGMTQHERHNYKGKLNREKKRGRTRAS